MRKLLSVCLIGAVFTLSSCNRDGIGDPRVVANNTPAKEIFQLAEAEIAKGNMINAGDYYLEVERLYPFSANSERALILAAKSYHDASALVESRIAAERYLQFFPGGRDAPLAQYLVALSYYDGIVDISRDQERTFMALQALQIVIDKYPNTEYAKLAKPKFDICLNQLAGKEMEIGRYYLKRKLYTSAIARFKAVIEEYPVNLSTAEAYHRTVEAYLGLGLVDEAQRAFAKSRQFGTDNAWYPRTQQLMKSGTQPNAGFGVLDRMLTS